MKRQSNSWRLAFSRGVAALSAVLVLGVMRPAYSSPGEIFSTAAPAITDAPPPTSGIADGESGVSTNTGAFTYSYSIKVPPGRGGLQPNLSLQYSSQAPTYGTLAAGWALSGLPIITEDTSGGRLWGTKSLPPMKRYQSSLAGNRPLFTVAEATPAGTGAYRAQNDSSWMRYQYYPTGNFWWRALAPDGTKYYFGDKDSRTSGCTIVSAEYAPVTRVEDAFGNQLDFHYEQGVVGECRIRMITWGQNAVAGLYTFAKTVFTYASSPLACPDVGGVPVGSQTSYRGGTKIVTGASQLDRIESTAFPPAAPGGPQPAWEHKRTITLAYSTSTSSCVAAHAPYRALTSIQESAVGADAPQVDLPAISFGYGDASVNYGTPPSSSVPWGSIGTGAFDRNLGWGYRPTGGESWPTVEAMMLDVDGDGLVDRVVSEPLVDAGGNTTRCRARWYRNRGPGFGGTFASGGYIDMPTLKWATDNDPPPPNLWDGGPYATANTSTGTYERCALNYQRTAYRNSSPSFLGQCVDGASTFTCPQQIATNKGWCQDPLNPSRGTKSDCGIKTNGQGDTNFAWRWIDMDGDRLPDLVGAPITGGVISYDLQRGNYQYPQEPAIFGNFPACPSTPYAADPTNWTLDPYTMCGGMFPWMIYKNHGNGVFGEPRPGGSGTAHDAWGPLPTKIIYQPIALETSSGESSLTSTPVGQYQGTVDIDGDGFLDAVRQTSTRWNVYRNDGTGQLLPAVGAGSFRFGTPSSFFLSRTNYSASQNPGTNGVEGLEDFNGDGLVDHWVGTGSLVDVTYSNGLSFQSVATQLDRPGPDGESSVLASDTTGSPSWYVCRGVRTDSRRTLDLDGDGRSDLLSTNAGIPSVRYNLGGLFASSSSTSLGQGGGFHRFGVDSNDVNACLGPTKWWMVAADFIDLNGDGVKEHVEFSPTGQNYLSSTLNPGPGRLLISINNARGSTTTIAYSSMNGPAVTQETATGKSSATTGWVASSVTSTDSFSNTTSTTSYLYRRPRVGADSDASFPNRFAFRGFEEVVTNRPGPTGLADNTGSKIVQRYDYSVDWSGRLVETLVQPGTADGAVVTGETRTIERTAWKERTLFGGELATFHNVGSEKLVCANGQTDPALNLANPCTPATAPGYMKTSINQSTIDSTLWADTSSYLQSGTAVADGDRESLTTYQLSATADSYFLKPVLSVSNYRSAGAMVLYGKSSTTWDPNYGTKLSQETWVSSDPTPSTHLIERWVYNNTTGNLIEHWKPKQNAANSTKTTHGYDARQLFASTTINEVGHRTDSTFDYGTGVTLLVEGPNERTCTTCPVSASHPLKEQHKTRVDGLGRMIERWETVSPDAYDFTLTKAETNSYVDAATATVPRSSTNYLLVDENGTTWRQQRNDIDGHGRPIRTTVFAQGTAPADQVTLYAYRGDGTLKTVSLPDPTTNDASLVAYTYTFDTLARPTSFRRPDSTTPSSQSGVNITYNGVTQTTTEVVLAAEGAAIAETQSINDKYGRLRQVKEKTAAPSTYATTTYSYGPDDAVTTIVDPQGVTTSLVHDFAGRRTQITRGSKIWKYGYDQNGNMTSEQVPGSTGVLTDPDFTTTTVYDDLDRELSKVIGKRTLSDIDRALFVNGTEVFTYDVGFKGQLRYWQCYAPGDGQSHITVDLLHDAQGRQTANVQASDVAGYPVVLHRFMTEYYITGNRRYARSLDFMNGGTNETITKTHYDARNLPSKVEMLTPQALNIGVQTRNVAGLVTKRRTDLTGPMTFIESNWTYDKLGRVTNQVVQRSTTPTQVARQTMTYFGNDDIRTLQHQLATLTSRTFTYGYDLRHQLKTTTTNTASYFGASYQYGTAGRLTRATHTRTISPTPANADPRLVRNVNYVYGGSDPEQVTSLTNVSGGAVYASYTYDAAGNQVTRSYPGSNELFEYTYDGKDQLRRVVRKVSGVVQGSEEYWYDGFGDRIEIVKRNASGTKTEMIKFAGDVESHFDGAGTATKIYTNVSLGTTVARVERTSNTRTALEFQFHGHASNTLAAVAQNGTINAGFLYAPFGERLESTDGGGATQGVAAHRRRFNDKYEDELGGLTYYGARYYDKTLIGWTQGDPLYRFAPDSAWKTPRHANSYAFDGNNPLRYIDPDGRSVVTTLAAKAGIELEPADLGVAGDVLEFVAEKAANTLPITAIVNTIDYITSDGDADLDRGSVGGKEVKDSSTPKPAPQPAPESTRPLRSGKQQADAARAEQGGRVLHDGDGATQAEMDASAGGPTAGEHVDKRTRQTILAEDRNPDGTWTCWRCGHTTDDPSKIDIGHKNVSRSMGGTTHRSNLACEGKACNQSAGNRGAPNPGRSCAERGDCGTRRP